MRFGLVSAETLADAVEAHPLMQSKAGKGFVHEAYRYQALPPENRDGFASSMAARARPRVPAGLEDGGDALSSSSASAAVRPNRPGSGDGAGGRGLRAIGIVDEDGGSSCEEGGGGRDAESEEEGCGPDEDAENKSGDGPPRAAPVSGVAEEMNEGEGAGGGGRSGDLSMKTNVSPSRRSWGAGLRMYV